MRNKLSVFNIALLYVGTLMGAGFASGREIWQFFGVFGNRSYLAVLAVTALFVLFGMMTVKISKTIQTTEIGKIVLPFHNGRLVDFFGTVTAAILFIIYIVMAAAGGALFHEQFGLPEVFGGIILMLMVIFTILGGFDRISRSFKYIIPVLLAIVFFVCLQIIFRQLPTSGREAALGISPLTPSWYASAVIYISYNMLAGIPILANCAHRAKSYQTALAGAALGGLLLGLSALVMDLAMLSDPGLSSNSVLPILALSGKLSAVIRWVYAVLLLFAVYSSATSNFYGFTTRMKEGRNKKAIIILAAIAGFLLSLFGFAEIIAFILPLEGYFGLLILIGMTVNYVRIRKADGKGDNKTEMKNQDYHGRFDLPEGMKRVTAGSGGEVILIEGTDKTAVIDCGMAYCGEGLAAAIKAELGARPLDYAVLTHTHYDHIGGLPYLRRAWPGLVSFGAAYGKKVLEKDSALMQIEALSKSAWKKYTNCAAEPEVLMEGLRIDNTVCEKDVIPLGGRELHVFETPGHTNCSLTFLLEPDGILFPSETIGVYSGDNMMVTGMLKSCRETIASIEKCRNINVKHIISPHFGIVPEPVRERYWDLALQSVERNKTFIRDRLKEGALFEEIMEEYTKEFYQDSVAEEQPKEAFLLNAQNMIQNLIREIRG